MTDIRNKKELHIARIQKRLKFLRTFMYSRLLIIILLILIQFAFFFVVDLKLEPYTKYFFGGSAAISIIFLTYLVNCSSKNEFKLAWLLPVLIVPVFGISLYFLYKTNSFGKRFKKDLIEIKKGSRKLLSNLPETQETYRLYPKIKDISLYLICEGNYPAYTNTSTEYFPSGEAVFPDMLNELKKAQHFIFIEYFIIEPSYMWNEILKILRVKANEGIDVRVLYDSIGSITFSTRQYEKYLQSFGIKAKIFQPFVPVFDTSLNTRDHRKILDIDGQVAYTGGINISDEYINRKHTRFNYWKDTAIKLKGPAVRTFTVMFLQQWNLANKTTENYEEYVNISYPIEPPQGAVIPYGDDAYNNADIAENVYNYILSKSHNYVHIITPYIILDDTLLNALIFAAKRNVDVTLLVPKHYDHLITFCVGRTFIKTLIKNGIRVFAYEPGFIHAKVFVSDNNRATVGSINLDSRSLYHHFECGTFLYDAPVILDIEKDFIETKEKCTEITMQEYKKTPLSQRIIGWMFRIFSSLL